MQNLREDLERKSVIVTGAASGLGQATALLLGEYGCHVTLADVNEADGRKTAERIQANGGKAQFVRTDVSEEANVRAMVDAAVSAYGRLDAAINCAAVNQNSRLLHELSLADWDRVHDVDLRGMFLCLKYQITAMLKSGGGSIVAVGSAAAVMGIGGMTEYNAAKAAIGGLVRGAAVDYATSNIRINALHPGSMDTPMTKAATAADADMSVLIARVPMKRMAPASEVAQAAIWLISDQASYVTGASLLVDGGLSIS